MKTEIPLLGLAAYSGTGKTTLLSHIIRIFRDRGLRVGVIKHAHHSFEIDYPGKDSYELRKAGASQLMIGSRKRWALIVDRENVTDPGFERYLETLDQSVLDIILVEGFKPEAIPKIELHREELQNPLLCREDPSIIAIASNSKDALDVELPVLDLDQPEQVADFIIDRYLPGHRINPNSANSGNR